MAGAIPRGERQGQGADGAGKGFRPEAFREGGDTPGAQDLEKERLRRWWSWRLGGEWRSRWGWWGRRGGGGGGGWAGSGGGRVC